MVTTDVKEILAEREERYGTFSEHAALTQLLKLALRSSNSWDKCSDVQKQSLEMVIDKIVRIVNGDTKYADNWVDIIGYAQLALNELPPTLPLYEKEENVYT